MTQQPTNKTHFARKLLFRTSLAVVILVALFLALLPTGTKYYLKQWLLDNGADEAAIKDVNINIFSGKASLTGIDIRKDGRTLLSNSAIEVNLNPIPLFERKILIQEAVLDNVAIEIKQYENGNIQIGPYTIQADTEPSTKLKSQVEDEQPWIFQSQKLSLSDVTIHYIQPGIDLKLVVDKGNINQFDTDPNARGGTLSLKGTLNGAPFEIDLSSLRLIPDIEIKGAVSVKDFKLDTLANIVKDSLHNISGAFTGQGALDLAISENKEIGVAYKGKLNVSEYSLEQDAYTTSGKQIQWDGNVNYASAEKKLDLEGIITGQELQALLTKPNYKTELSELTTNSKLSITLAENTEVSTEGSLQLVDFTLVEPGAEAPLVALNTLLVSNINWTNAEGLLVDKVGVDSIIANILHKKSTEQEKTTDVKQLDGDIVPMEETTAKKSDSPPIRIRNIAFTGNNRVTITDNALSSPFTTSLVITSLQVSNIDTSKPDEPITYTLQGTFDEIAPVNTKGSALLFGNKTVVDQEIQLRNYSLSRISPYVVETIGNALDAGQLDLTSTFKIEADTIDSKNNVVLKNIEIRPVNDELNQQFNNLLPVPLNFALNLLKDSKGNIDLDVPVSGQFSQLNVGLTDILTTAFSEAIITGVTPYLAYLFLGPTTGALAYLGVKATQKLLNAGFPVLKYETGNNALSDENKEILKKIGKQIEKDKDQSYTVCARLPIWELTGDMEKTTENQHKILQDEKQQKKLFELGQQRTRDVHSFLLENFNIKQEHLLMCDPGLNLDKNSIGTVEILK